MQTGGNLVIANDRVLDALLGGGVVNVDDALLIQRLELDDEREGVQDGAGVTGIAGGDGRL